MPRSEDFQEIDQLNLPDITESLLSRDELNSLADFEEWLRWQFTQVTLIGEVTLSKSEWRKLGKNLGEKLSPLTKGQAHRVIHNEFPASFASFLVSQGVFGYHGGTYWPGVVEKTGLKKPQIGPWGKYFEEVIRRFGLAQFEDMPGLRFVSVILAHGGVPDYCLPDFFERILLKAITDPWYADLSIEELIDAILDEAQVQFSVDKPVQRFMEFGDKVSEDFLARCIEMAQHHLETNEFSDVSEFGLPARIGEHFAEWVSEQDTVDPLRPHAERLRLKKPRIVFDPWGDGLSIRLPSQEIPARFSDSQFSWTISSPGIDEPEPTVQLRARQIGLDYRIDERDFTIEKLHEAVHIQLLFDGIVRRSWRQPLYQQTQPLLLFDPRTGDLISWKHSIPAQSLWLIHAEDTAIAFEGEADLTEQFPPQVGILSKFKGGEWNLSKAKSLTLTPRASDVKRFPVRQSSIRSVPVLIGSNEFSLSRDVDDARIFFDNPPMLHLPSSGRQTPGEEAKRWRLSLSSKWAASPEVNAGFTPDIQSEFVEVAPDVLIVDLSDSSLLGPNPVGTYLLKIRGPLGSDALFKFRILPRLEFHDLKPTYYPQDIGEDGISFGVTSGDKLELEPQLGAAESGVRLLEQSKGNYLVEVDPSADFAPLLGVQKRERGESIQVPFFVPMPILKWSKSAPALSDQNPNNHPLACSLDEVLSPEHDFWVRLQYPILGGEETEFGLSLLDREERILQHGRRFNSRDGWHAYRLTLNEFKDTLRSSSSAIFKVELQIEPDGNLNGINRIHILTLKEPKIVDRLQVVETNQSWIFEWENLNSASNRELRLIPLWRPWEQARRFPIQEDSDNQLVLSKEESILARSRYAADVVVVDPWVGRKQNEVRSDLGEGPFTLIDLDEPITRKTELTRRIDSAGEAVFDSHFERACLASSLDETNLMESDLRWCVASIDKADLQEILALHWYLNNIGADQHVENLAINMYEQSSINRILYDIHSKTITERQLDDYVAAAPDPSHISVDAARLMLKINRPAAIHRAIQSLLANGDRQVVHEIQKQVTEKRMSDRDAFQHLSTDGSLAVSELASMSNDATAFRLLEGLIPYLGDEVPLVRVGSWLWTEAGWGKVSEIADESTGEPLDKFIYGRLKPKIKLVLRAGETNENVFLNLADGTLSFDGSEEVWVCTRCFQYSTQDKETIFSRHNMYAHDGMNTSLMPLHSDELEISSVRFSHQRPGRKELWI